MDKKTTSLKHAWIIWICVSFFYLYEYVLRVAPSVMADDLMRDFNITASSIGILGSLYYIPYAVLQIPAGMIVDYLGTKRIITLSSLLCVIGAFLFAFGDTFYEVEIGRFLIGMGSACAYLSCLKVVADWFPHSYFPIMAGLSSMMGVLGGALGQPFSILVDSVGWRDAMLWMAILGVGTTIISWFLIKDKRVFQAEESSSFWTGIKNIMANSQVWLIAIYGLFFYVPVSVFAELWGVPYLMKKYSIDKSMAMSINMMLFIGKGIGAPLVGWASTKYQSRKKFMNLGLLWTLFAFICIVFVPMSLAMISIMLLLAGIGIGGQVLAFTCNQEINSPDLSGTAIGFTNAILMMSGVLFQPLLGNLLDYVWDGAIVDGIPFYSVHDYRTAMIVLPVCLLLAYIFLFFIKETFKKER
jgi:sugar phosphate permease